MIPYIEFVGSVSELAEVFEKLNRGGVKLTKYQVFAAQFSKYNLYLNNDKYNKQILTHIIERYKYLNEDVFVNRKVYQSSGRKVYHLFFK